MHEFVLSAATLKRRSGVRALDVAKRLLEEGFHAPTIYFPLIVDEALMIEPTETESLQTLEALAEAFERIALDALEPGGESRALEAPLTHAGAEGGRGTRRAAADSDRGRPLTRSAGRANRRVRQLPGGRFAPRGGPGSPS